MSPRLGEIGKPVRETERPAPVRVPVHEPPGPERPAAPLGPVAPPVPVET